MDVASRVQEIQDSTDKKQWHYIESQLNPRIRYCAKREPRNFMIQDGFYDQSSYGARIVLG